MRRVVVILLSFVLTSAAVAQNTGYLGKHLILKTDAVNGKRLGFQNADVEVAVSRNFSLSASGRYINYATSKQTGLETGTKGYDIVQLTDVIPKKTKGMMGALGAKYYFNRISPAPMGYFVGLELGGGYITADYRFRTRHKYESEPALSEAPVPEPTDYQSGTFSAPVIFASHYVGYQTMFFKFLTVEARIGLEGYYTLVSSNIAANIPYNYVEPNTVPIRVFPKNKNSIEEATKREYRFSAGPAVYVKLGFLLF